MRNLFAILCLALAFAAVPAVHAQTSGDVIVIQRSGTNTVSLPGLGSGAAYALIRTGTAALTSGSCTITDSNVTSGSIFHLQGVGTTNAGNLTLGTVVSGTSFQVVSTSGSDARVFHWWFLKQ